MFAFHGPLIATMGRLALPLSSAAGESALCVSQQQYPSTVTVFSWFLGFEFEPSIFQVLCFQFLLFAFGFVYGFVLSLGWDPHVTVR